MTQARELALGGRVVAFAAGSLTLTPRELDQPALIEPRSGAFMHPGSSLMGRAARSCADASPSTKHPNATPLNRD